MATKHEENYMEKQLHDETPAETKDELSELILTYLPPIPNSQGYECRGTVAETLAEVLREEGLINDLADTGSEVEWQARMPHENPEYGWKKVVEGAAIYLEAFHGAEVRTRVVSEWKHRAEQ